VGLFDFHFPLTGLICFSGFWFLPKSSNLFVMDIVLRIRSAATAYIALFANESLICFLERFTVCVTSFSFKWCVYLCLILYLFFLMYENGLLNHLIFI
jgi:hypothetical protein